MSSGVHLQISGVEKAFGSRSILKGIHCELPPGAISVLIGASGCGKSTLLRLLIGLISPDAGTLSCNGQPIHSWGPREWGDFRQQVGMVFQHSALFDSLTVGENVGFSLREHTRMSEQEIRVIVAEKLKVVGLAGQEDAYPSELSGGMQKRVAIARAIARNPSLILYDEPTTGLDPITSTVIEDLIIAVSAQTRATSVVVTHQISTIQRTADRIIMLHEGRVLDQGPAEKILQSTDPLISGFLRGEPARAGYNESRG